MKTNDLNQKQIVLMLTNLSPIQTEMEHPVTSPRGSSPILSQEQSPHDSNAFLPCRCPHSEYRTLRILGEGTYGVVYDAIHLRSGKRVALKKIRTGEDQLLGLPTSALREAALLRSLEHPNVVELLDICYSAGTQLWLTFERCETDLRQLLRYQAAKLKAEGKIATVPYLPYEQCKGLARQLLSALAFCHSRRIIHRDIKPQNILINKALRDSTGFGTVGPEIDKIMLNSEAHLELKLADFGLARSFARPKEKNTHEVVTLWYRAPEVLLGDDCYDSSLDIWSAGCVIVEVLLGKALFRGLSEIDTLLKIFSLLGTPVEGSCYPTADSACSRSCGKASSALKDDANRMKSDVQSFSGTLAALSASTVSSISDKEDARRRHSVVWNGCSKLPYYQPASVFKLQETFPFWKASNRSVFRKLLWPLVDENLIDLLFRDAGDWLQHLVLLSSSPVFRIFQYDPARRPTAQELLHHPWLHSDD